MQIVVTGELFTTKYVWRKKVPADEGFRFQQNKLKLNRLVIYVTEASTGSSTCKAMLQLFKLPKIVGII